MSIQSLCPEIKYEIFSFLNPNDLGKCASVCREWRCIADNNLCWKNIFKEKFKGDISQAPSLKQLYIEMKRQEISSEHELLKRIQQFVNKIGLHQKGKFTCIFPQPRCASIVIQVQDFRPKCNKSINEVWFLTNDLESVNQSIKNSKECIHIPVMALKERKKKQILGYPTTANFYYPWNYSQSPHLEKRIHNIVYTRIQRLKTENITKKYSLQIISAALYIGIVIVSSRVTAYCLMILTNIYLMLARRVRGEQY